MPRRVKIGDIIEIPTSKGLAYAQYTHKNADYGSLIRVIRGVFNTRPASFEELAQEKSQFVVFFPIGVAVHRGILAVVGHADIPEHANAFPLFRAGAVNPSGKVGTWWLWDGQKSWPIGHLSRDQCSLPIRSIVNVTALIWMIETGYTSEKDRCFPVVSDDGG